MTQETESQYIERRVREENTERFRKEFQQHELLRKAAEAREAEEAKNQAERTERGRVDEAARATRAANADTERCKVCGQEVPKACVSHIVYGTSNKCVRKVKAARACGIITQDAWETLTPEEIENGFIIPEGAVLQVESIYRSVTPELIAGTVNPLLR